jgi:oligopeptidase A
MTQNPLLVSVDAFVDYAAVRPEHIEPAVESLIGKARAAVEAAANATPTWDAFVEPLDAATAPLWRAWAVAGHLNAVVNTPELRDAYNRGLTRITEFSTWMGLHTGLYAQYKALEQSPGFAQLSPVRRRIVELALRDFRLSGVELQGAQRARYTEVSDQLANASQKFSENVLDAQDQWSLLVDNEARLDGLPADVKRTARDEAQRDGADGWKLTLKMPCYLPVMQYAHDQGLRQALYRARATLASEQGDPALDNSALIEKLLALRGEEASILGYDTFAELALQTRMAAGTQQVLEFLRDLAARAKPYAQRDLDALHAFARDELGMQSLEPWDVAYASERLRERDYAYSDDEVKQYFTEPKVLQGLFATIGRLFGIRMKTLATPAWHADVKALQVESARDGTVLGHLFMDLYARQGKQGGAWVDSERSRCKTAAHVHTPIAYLTCNFSQPHGDTPALLTHDDVITLFHETGHAMHTLLSQVDEPAAAPFASVEWDAVELPSQFMENFCWEWPVVRQLSAHVDTGKSLPRALYDKLLAARNFQSGMQAVRQIEFALFDMLVHQGAPGQTIADVQATLGAVRDEVAVLFPPAWHRFAHGFSHIFAGGYAAGYYSYKWAEVLSADAYAAFEETAGAGADGTRDTVNAETGALFRDQILAVGGSRPSAESFRAFRGRDATVDALLRHSGMLACGSGGGG